MEVPLVARLDALAMADPPPIAWDDHPLAASGGEVMAQRVLPLMGHNACDYARAAVVCHGWTGPARAASATVRRYRETVLQIPEFRERYDRWEDDKDADQQEWEPTWVWSPCGLFVLAAVFRYSHTQFYLWRASNGALVSDWWHYQPDSLQRSLEDFYSRPKFAEGDRLAFSRDSAHVVTLIKNDHYFVVWSVLDGRMVANNELVPASDLGHPVYGCPDFGVPGTASAGLVGFGSMKTAFVDLWIVAGPLPPTRLCSVNLNGNARTKCFAFSKDGASFAAAYDNTVCLYDVASLTRLGTFRASSMGWWDSAKLSWLPSGRLMLGTRQSSDQTSNSACIWFIGSSPVPAVEWTGPERDFKGWSSNGTSYFQSRADCTTHPVVMFLEERRADDHALLRRVQVPSVEWRSQHDDPIVLAPDERALLMVTAYGQARVTVFDG